MLNSDEIHLGFNEKSYEEIAIGDVRYILGSVYAGVVVHKIDDLKTLVLKIEPGKYNVPDSFDPHYQTYFYYCTCRQEIWEKLNANKL